MIKKVVFISNDFGFGPMSRSYTIAKSLKEIQASLDVLIVSSGANDHLFNQNSIKFININDTRDKAVIDDLLEKFDTRDTFFVSVMNRFVIEPAKKRGFAVLLVDGLYWYWKNRPVEYSFADYEFRCVLPWMISNYKNKNLEQYYISPVETVSRVDVELNINVRNSILMSINGFMTPFYKESHNSYLDFIALVANVIGEMKSISIVGNAEFAEYMNNRLNPNVRYSSPDKSTYLELVARTNELLLLNGGSNSFLEAFWMKKNIVFSLPSNQSQYELIVSLAAATNKSAEYWCPLLELFPNHSNMSTFKTETEALDFWSNEIAVLLSEGKVYKNIELIVKNIILDEGEKNRSNSLSRLYNASKEQKDSAKQMAYAIALITSNYE